MKYIYVKPTVEIIVADLDCEILTASKVEILKVAKDTGKEIQTPLPDVNYGSGGALSKGGGFEDFLKFDYEKLEEGEYQEGY